MSSYKYVVFPRGRQPSAAELAQLQSVAAALGGRYAWGTCRDEPRLAVARPDRSIVAELHRREVPIALREHLFGTALGADPIEAARTAVVSSVRMANFLVCNG